MITLSTGAKRILAAALLLTGPCILSGAPQLFTDTKSYYVLGKEIGSLVGVPTPGSPAKSAELLRGRALAASDSLREERLAYTVAGSRSPYYSFYLFLLASIGSAWLVVAVQCALTALVLWIALRAWGLDRHLVPIVLMLAVGSSAAVFAFFVMPDFAMALAILAFAVLATRWHLTRGWERVVLGATIAMAALFHLANALVLLTVALLWLTVCTVKGGEPRTTRRGVATALAMTAIGLIGLLAYPVAVRALRHERLYSPPFLAARLIADGPGRTYLRQRCGGGARTSWCRFVDQPLSDNNQILWSDDPKAGAFQLADYDLRVALIKEQPGFVLDVFRNDPVSTVETAIRNAGALLLNFRVQEVLEDGSPVWTNPEFRVLATLIPGADACMAGRRSCASRLDYHLLDMVFGATASLSMLAVAALMLDPRMRARWGAVTWVILAFLVVNAAIFGVVSGNAQRYQSRIMWLLPLLALCMISDRKALGRSNSLVRPAAPPVSATVDVELRVQA